MSDYGEMLDRAKLMKALEDAEPKKSKYRNKRVSKEEGGGRSFMSQGERDCAYEYLHWLEKGKLIRDIEYQVTVLLMGIRYVLDFKYWDIPLGEPVWADFKGFEGERWKILLKLWPQVGPGRLRVYKGKGKAMTVTKEIIPNG